MQALLPLLIVVPLWFILIRPQRRRIQNQQAMVRSLEVGDDVLTSAGIYGSIVALDDEIATLEVAEGVRLRIARKAVGRRLNAHAGERENPTPGLGEGSSSDGSGPAIVPPVEEA